MLGAIYFFNQVRKGNLGRLTGLHVIATANAASLKKVLIVLEEEHTTAFARTRSNRVVLNLVCRTTASFCAAELSFTL